MFRLGISLTAVPLARVRALVYSTEETDPSRAFYDDYLCGVSRPEVRENP